MIKRRVWFAVLVLLTGAALIRADVSGSRAQVYLFKPLAIVLVLLMVLGAAPRSSPRYRTLIATALCWSLVGDVLLMLPANLFAAGLGCFLLAHLCYVAAFVSQGAGRAAAPAGIAPFAFLAGVMLAALWPVLGALRIPVALYIGVISTMAWQAWARWHRVRSPGALRAAIGSLFFLTSDGMLAFHRFRGPIGDRATVTVGILSTYLVAQFLIASSVGDE